MSKNNIHSYYLFQDIILNLNLKDNLKNMDLKDINENDNTLLEYIVRDNLELNKIDYTR